MAACKLGHAEAARALLLQGTPPNYEGTDNKWTPLLWAACRGHLDCVSVLLEAKASEKYVDRADADGADRALSATGPVADGLVSRASPPLVERNSPLHWAAFKGHLPCVWKLMGAGLSIHDVDHCGNSALHLAVAGGHVDVTTCLLQNGADMVSPNYFGNAPLSLATGPEIREALTVLMAEQTYRIDMTCDLMPFRGCLVCICVFVPRSVRC
eukprot:SAG31_NODE_4224_length_3447_cov_2.493130_4_plen_212_part_00